MRTLMCVVLFVLVACDRRRIVSVGRDAASETATAAGELETFDARGQRLDGPNIPCAPRFRLQQYGGTPLLFKGPVSDAEVAALRRNNTIFGARTIALQPSDSLWSLANDAYLQQGETYTLALPASNPLRLYAMQVDPNKTLCSTPQNIWPPNRASLHANTQSMLVLWSGEPAGLHHLAWNDAVLAHEPFAPCPQGFSCFRYSLPMVPTSAATVRIAANVVDPSGATLPPSAIATYSRNGANESPPAFAPIECSSFEQALDVGCLQLRGDTVSLRAATPSPALLLLRYGESWITRSMLDSEEYFEFARPGAATLEAALFSGGPTTLRLTFSLPTSTPELPTVAIAEVMANPFGREPEQEYLELVNFGSHSQMLHGLVLVNGDVDVALPDVELPASGHIVIAGPTFDRRAAENFSDGITVVRVPRWFSRGLSNEGFSLSLLNAEGARLSRVEHRYPSVEGRCSVRDDRARWTSLLAEYPSNAACTPGY